MTITHGPDVDITDHADTPWGLASPMRVKKRDGGMEPVDLNKIVRAVGRACRNPDGSVLDGVDPMRVATRTISGLCDGATTMELDELSIRTAAALVSEEPSYSRLAGRLLATFVQKEVFNQNIHSFSQSISAGSVAGLIGQATADLVADNAYKLNEAIDHDRDQLFEYFGLRTVYDRYLLRDPESRLVIETPQYFFMRVACGLSTTADDAVEFYRLISSLDYLPATPTLFNSGTTHPQMSSCFAAGTPVFTTNRGLVPIEQVVVGDETITHTGATASVTQIHRNPLGDRALYDITVAGLRPITITGNHRVWAATYGKKRGMGTPGWINADELQIGDYVALSVGHDLKGDEFVLSPLTHQFDRELRFGDVDREGMTSVRFHWSARDHLNGSDNRIVRTRAMSPVRAEWRFDSIDGARFLGQWFGDGSVVGESGRPDGISLTFGNGERPLAERWAEVGERIFGVKAHFYGDDNGRGWGSVSFHSAVVGELFVATFGRYSHDKSLPTAFYSMNRTFTESFLKGLIESDGCVASGGVSVTMTNLDLLSSVAAWGRSHGLPITYSAVPKYEDSRFRRQASLRIPCWAIDLADLGKVYDDERIADLADAKPSTRVKVIGGRPYVRVMAKVAAEPVHLVYNLGVAHDDHSYSADGLAVANCYLLDSPSDTLEAIYDRYKDVARLSKFAGGIGLAFHRVRSRGSLIRGTNGLSNGIVPWLKTLDSSVSAVNQCFAPDTIVFTADGPTPIRDVTTGDVVLGISGTYREVTEKFTYNQTDPMVSVDVKHSIEPIHVTAGHPFYAMQGIPVGSTVERSMRQIESGTVRAEWVEAGELRVGDFLAQPIPTEVVDSGISVDDARMLGIMLGDGHIRSTGHEYGVTWSPATDVETAEFVRSYLAARGVHFWETEMHGGSACQIRWSAGLGLLRDGTTGQYVSGGSSALPFTRVDLYTADGAKRIGRRFSHMSPRHTLALLHGLLVTDGNVSRGDEITFTSSSRHLAEGVRYQLLRLGVATSGQHRVRHNAKGGTRRDGSRAEFSKPTECFDIRIPAIPELARLVGAKPLTKKNWLTWQGCVWSRVRKVTEAPIVPFVFDLVVDGDESYTVSGALAHNGGKRKGAACVYLETWHADIEEFLALKENTGDEARRTHNLNLANWVPDLFMERVEKDWTWSLFDPKKVPHLTDLFGKDFESAYQEAESKKLYERQVPARQLYSRMMRTLAQTGNGWMTFKDPSNARCNQTTDVPAARPGSNGVAGSNGVDATEPPRVVHLSNLCTEIIEVTSNDETAVCNLGSINLGHFVVTDPGSGVPAFDFERLGRVAQTAVRYLDRVIDINYYPTDEASVSNARWRPVGLGSMGLQDVLFKMRLPFDSPEARELSRTIAEEIYFNALSASCDLAEERGPHQSFPETRLAAGHLQFDLAAFRGPRITPTDSGRWDALRLRIAEHGVRNSLLIAIAPTATIASIVGAYECIEPQVSNLFKRETLSGEFMQINTYLVRDLQERGLWTDDVRDAIKRAEGSVQSIETVPDDVKALYRTAWELPMRSLIDMAAERGAFIDQSQSLNLFMESPTIGKLSSMYLHAWKQGLKTTYYLRSRPATRITQTTTGGSVSADVIAPVQPIKHEPPAEPATEPTDEEVIACSVANPESCDACQ